MAKKAVQTNAENFGYFNPRNVYRPEILSIELVGEWNPNDGAINTYRITQNDGKIFDFDVKNGSGGSAGRSVESVEQIEISTESRGKNIARITLSDGTYTDVEIRNGAQGETGPQGLRGPAGIDSVEAAIGTNDPAQAPSVDKDLTEGVLSLTFNNIKGEKGDQGEPAVAVENYVTVEATAQTTAATDVLPATGDADTVYRVANWDGTQYDDTAYTEYGWYDGAYKMLATRTPGIDDEPTAGSQKLVKSGGVAAQISQLGQEFNLSEQFVRKFKNNSDRDNGRCTVGDGNRYAESSIFTMFIPIYSYYSKIIVRGIGSSRFPSLVVFGYGGNVLNTYFYQDLDKHIIELGENVAFCFVNYYTDTAAQSGNLPLFDGAYLMPRINAKKSLSLLFDSGEIDVIGNNIEEHPNYYSSEMICAKIDVEEDQEYFIKGEGRIGARLFIVLDENNNILDISPTYYSVQDGTSIVMPKYAKKLCITSFYKQKNFDVIYKGLKSFGVSISDKDLIHRGQRFFNGQFIIDNSAVCSDYIEINNSKEINFLQWLSSTQPQVFFFNSAKSIIGKVYANDAAYHRYRSALIPDGTRYIVVNASLSQKITFKIIGERINKCGRFPNALVSKSTAQPTDVFIAEDLQDYPVSMVPQIWGDSQFLYCVCEKRVSQADSGISSILLSRYNLQTAEINKVLVFESTREVGRYHNAIIWKDTDGILGTAGRLYVFAIKVNASAIDVYITSLTDKSQSDCVYKYSDDEGLTWGQEVSLKEYYPDDAIVFGPSPSQPIVLQNGILCIPGYVVVNSESGYDKFRCGMLVYNNGWIFSIIDLDGSPTDNECTIVEYGRNTVLCNARNFKGTRSAYYTILQDTSNILWNNHISSEKFLTLNEYGCQGCIVKRGDYYLFQYVDVSDVSGRANLCLWISFDLCGFYPILYITLNGTIGGYGNLYIDENNNIYTIYESNQSRTTISIKNITTEVDNAIVNAISMFSLNDYKDLLIAGFRKQLNP